MGWSVRAAGSRVAGRPRRRARASTTRQVHIHAHTSQATAMHTATTHAATTAERSGARWTTSSGNRTMVPARRPDNGSPPTETSTVGTPAVTTTMAHPASSRRASDAEYLRARRSTQLRSVTLVTPATSTAVADAETSIDVTPTRPSSSVGTRYDTLTDT